MIRHGGKKWQCLVSAVALWCTGSGLASATTEVTAVSTENAPSGATATSSNGNHTLTVGGNWTLADNYRIGSKILGQMAPTGDMNFITVVSENSIFKFDNWNLALTGAATGGGMMMNSVSVTGATINGDSLKMYGAIPFESLIGGQPSTSAVAISTNSVIISDSTIDIANSCQIYGENGVVNVDNGSVTISNSTLSVENDAVKISGALCDQGNIINSKVEITDSTLTPQSSVYLYGAEFGNSTAPENTLLKGNVVNLSGAKLSPTASANDSTYLYLHGADFMASKDSPTTIVAGTEAGGNSVTITGNSILNYNSLDLCGAYGYGVSAMTGNGVNISGGVFGYQDSAKNVSTQIYGAKTISDSAMSGNYVAISGGNFGGRNADVYAASGGTASSVNPNAVYLSGSPEGIESMDLFGGEGTQTGSLYVGAQPGDNGAELATSLAAKDKDGNLTNKFSSLNNFNNIYLYKVVPIANVPVLSAKSFTAGTGNNAVLHLETMNLETLPADPLTLLQIDEQFIGTANGVVKVYDGIDERDLKPNEIVRWNYEAPDKIPLTNVDLEATGEVEIVSDPEKHTIILQRGTEETLNTVRIRKATDVSDTLPEDRKWKTPASGPIIDTSTMELPDAPPGEIRDILKAPDNFFQPYRMTNENAYIEEPGSEADYMNGVRFSSWVEKKGVLVTGDDKGNKNNVIQYWVPRKTVTNISLGGATWGTAREATSDYEFSGKTMSTSSTSGLTINASDFNLTVGNDDAAKLAAGDAPSTTTLLTKATNLEAGLSVIGAEHSQNVDWTAGNGAALTATMTGTVSTTEETINYTVKDLTPTLVDLSGWAATKEDVVPDGWQHGTSVPVNAESIDVAPGSLPLLGANTILTTAKEGFFDDDKITGSYKYDERVSFNHEQKGVTLTGTWSRGVEASKEDKGKSLIFVNGELKSSHVTLGQMEWKTPRELKGNCDFTGATVDASGLTFEEEGLKNIAKGDSSHLLTGATNLPGTTINHTQSFPSSTDNGVALSATMTGQVVATSTGIDYNVKTVALDNVDLAKWDSANASKLPETWTTAAVTVTADEMDTAPEKLLDETIILIANAAGVFKDDNISGTNKFAERKDYSHDNGTGVTLTGTWSRGVRASEEDNGTTLVFVNGDLIAKDVSLGSMNLGTSRDLKGKYDCDFTDATVSATGLTFKNLDAKTAVGGTFNLLTGAIDLAEGTKVTGANHTQNFDADAQAINDNEKTNGVKLSATLKGTVSVEKDEGEQQLLMAKNATNEEKPKGKIVYTPTSITLNSVDLSGWDSTVGKAKIEETWTPNPAGVSVNAGGMNAAPESALGETTILTSDKACFIDDNISGVNKYANRKDFSHDNGTGVTLTGKWSRGVKASEDQKSLIFVNGALKANTVTFGKMAWGTPRDLTGALNCDFIDATADASSLVFTNLTAKTAVGDKTDLLTGAKNLFADVKITGNDHMQDFIAPTANGVNLSATLEGAVTAYEKDQKGNIRYTANRITLNHVDLSTWDSAKSAATIEKSWTPNAAGVTVTADGMDAAPEELLGDTTILLADEGIFDDSRISGADKYGARKDLNDEQKGVAISGTWYRGVQAQKKGASLVFVNGDLKADNISLGKMDWGVSRDLTGKYNCDFTDTTVSATGLTFAVKNDDAAKLAAGDSKMLLTGANGLAADLHVDGADRSQSVDWTAGNKTVLTATMKGKVSTEADIVKYTVGSVTLDSVNLKNWNGTASTTPATWKANAAGVKVIADGMNTTPEELLGETTILSSAEACFTNGNISGANKYGARKELNDEQNGVAISGTWLRGVQASKDNKSLIFVNGDLIANEISLGQMTWGVSRNLTGKYNCDFSNAKVSATDLAFTFQNDDAAKLAAGDSKMLLIGANGLDAGLPVDGANHSQTVDWTAGNKTVLTATMKGKVSTEKETVKYTVDGVTLDSVNLKNWNGTASSTPATWKANAAGVKVLADGMNDTPEKLLGNTTILSSAEACFTDDNISGSNKYGERKDFSHEKDGVTISGTWSRGVKAAEDKKSLVFVNGDLKANDISLGGMTWGVSRDLTGKLNCDFSNAKVSATDLAFTFQNDDAAKLTAGDWKMLLTGAKGLAAGLSVDGANHSQTVDWTAGNKTTLTATMKGTVSTEKETVKYTVGSVTLDSVNLAGWNGKASDVPTGWTANAAGVAVTAEGFTVHPEDMASHIVPILNASENTFSDKYITGEQAYHPDKQFRSEKDGVTLSGIWSHGVKASEDGATLLFEGADVAMKGVDLGEIQWKAGAVIRTATANALHYEDAVIDTSSFSVANPTDAAGGQSVTLLAANKTLQDFSPTPTNAAYSYSPVAGVQVDGHLSGTLSASNGVLAYNADKNSATNLTFRTVEWKETGALMERPVNISFDGAVVDTSSIAFTGVDMLYPNDVTTLVTGYDGKPSKYIGDSYRLGTAIGGAGHAWLSSDSNLKYTIDTVGAAPETHSLLMGMGAGLAVLSSGNSFIDSAAEGLSLASNAGADGVSTFAKMGGGSLRQETGSHVDIHTWNAILALGHKNEKPKGTTEYGAFFEYGSGNYTTMDLDRGDGNVTYTGGGLLAKWTAAHGFYVEGSLRGGSVKDDARSVLRDAEGTPYSYSTSAGYWGAHLGVGKEISLANGNTVDVYGKYFFNRRNGISFDAGDHFDLDALTSQVLRVGARYTAKREQWSFYGGLAYEYELDGVATGLAEGFQIRSADLSGGSVMAELGVTMQPNENSPWKLDLNLAGFAGKKQGFSGGASVAFMF